ncbi:MAG: RHS repeat-associated core domain-containing protein [Candidatus Micrarchaeota archaeon]
MASFILGVFALALLMAIPAGALFPGLEANKPIWNSPTPEASFSPSPIASFSDPSPQKTASCTQEVCDGLDNDCNQLIDDGNLCVSGYACVQGGCIRDGPPDGAMPLTQSTPIDLGAFAKSQTANYFAGSKKIAEKENSNLKYIHGDNLGSPVLKTDSAGTAIAGTSAAYDSFGASTGASAEFTGKPMDEGTGLAYFGARFYDPQIGRFVSADSLPGKAAIPQTFNRYSYVSNNPLKYIDPSGRQQKSAQNNVYFYDSSNADAIGMANEIISYVESKGMKIRGVGGLDVEFLDSNSGDSLIYGNLGQNGQTIFTLAMTITYMPKGSSSAITETNIYSTYDEARGVIDSLSQQNDVVDAQFLVANKVRVKPEFFSYFFPVDPNLDQEQLARHYFPYALYPHELKHNYDFFKTMGEIDSTASERNAFGFELNAIDELLIPKVKSDYNAGLITNAQRDFVLQNLVPVWRNQAKANK